MLVNLECGILEWSSRGCCKTICEFSTKVSCLQETLEGMQNSNR